MSAAPTRQLTRDIMAVQAKYPALREISNSKKISALSGNIVIRDEKDIYQGDFEIKILINENYPFHFPEMYELSNKIPRTPERHINDKGLTCVEVEPLQYIIAQKGISLLQYISTYAYKYFCAQLYYDSKNQSTGNEWKHHEEGIKEYFYLLLGSQNAGFINESLELIISNSLPERNDKCFCGSDHKYKFCHIHIIEVLKNIPINKLMEYKILFAKTIK